MNSLRRTFAKMAPVGLSSVRMLKNLVEKNGKKHEKTEEDSGRAVYILQVNWSGSKYVVLLNRFVAS